MTKIAARTAHAWDMTLLVVFTALFPVMSTLHPRVSNEVYQGLAGFLLGGVAALGNALLYDGFQRWRTQGWSGLERTRSLRMLLTLLVYPTLASVSILIWYVGSAGPNFGVVYDLGAGMGGGLMGWRATAALARKRKHHR